MREYRRVRGYIRVEGFNFLVSMDRSTDFNKLRVFCEQLVIVVVVSVINADMQALASCWLLGGG